MSSQLRVELPDHSWFISLSSDAIVSISDLKAEIHRTCPGNPRVNGQRLFSKGRLLLDSERLTDIWKSPEEAKVVHLSVNPSAWTTDRKIPTIPSPAPSAPPQIPQHAPPNPCSHPLTFILYKHEQALAILTHGKTPVSLISDLDIARKASKLFVQNIGWNWPGSFDTPLPASHEGGVEYDVTTIDGQRYISLKNPGAEPTPAQLHSIKILTFTFPILFLPTSEPSPTRPASTEHITLPPNLHPHLQQIDHHLQQVGLNPAPPEVHPPNANPNINIQLLQQEIRGIILRQTIYSYIYLAFRTVLLLYFVSPTRKPLFAVLVLFWVLYEIWRPIRAGLVAAAARRDRQNHGPLRDNVGPQQPINLERQPGQAQQAANIRPGDPIRLPIPRPSVEQQMMDTMASVNMEAETRILEDTQGPPPAPPTIYHKVVTFCQLLLVTVHPEIWNRRRIALRGREGRIKMEANTRSRVEDPIPEGQEQSPEDQNRARVRADIIAQHLRRPAWVREYTERVISGDWVDDAD